MRIALLGYGRMGKAIEQEALARNHIVSHRLDREEAADLTHLSTENTDLVIEFTHPDGFRKNLSAVLDQGLPLVTGTTGWYEQLGEVQAEVEQADGAVLYASNFSVGVNLFFKLNQRLGELMDSHQEYDPFVEERHHRNKADGPSGTAHTLAQDILSRLSRKDRISDEQLRSRAPDPNELSVSFSRAGDIKGTHRVTYTSEIDSITIEHQAYSRRGFALGAVVAAEWLYGKKGFFEFSEIF